MMACHRVISVEIGVGLHKFTKFTCFYDDIFSFFCEMNYSHVCFPYANLLFSLHDRTY